MCRRPLYFRGMRKKLAEWEQERIDAMKSSVFGRLFDDIINDVEPDYVLEELEWLDERFRKWGDLCFEDDDEMYEVLGDLFLDPIPVLVSVSFFDIWPYECLLFVSDHSEKRYRHPINTPNPMATSASV